MFVCLLKMKYVTQLQCSIYNLYYLNTYIGYLYGEPNWKFFFCITTHIFVISSIGTLIFTNQHLPLLLPRVTPYSFSILIYKTLVQNYYTEKYIQTAVYVGIIYSLFSATEYKKKTGFRRQIYIILNNSRIGGIYCLPSLRV